MYWCYVGVVVDEDYFGFGVFGEEFVEWFVYGDFVVWFEVEYLG